VHQTLDPKTKNHGMNSGTIYSLYGSCTSKKVGNYVQEHFLGYKYRASFLLTHSRMPHPNRGGKLRKRWNTCYSLLPEQYHNPCFTHRISVCDPLKPLPDYFSHNTLKVLNVLLLNYSLFTYCDFRNYGYSLRFNHIEFP
jgi:hypothetical protein